MGLAEAQIWKVLKCLVRACCCFFKVIYFSDRMRMKPMGKRFCQFCRFVVLLILLRIFSLFGPPLIFVRWWNIKNKNKNPFFHPFSFAGTQILSVCFNAMLLELLSGFFWRMMGWALSWKFIGHELCQSRQIFDDTIHWLRSHYCELWLLFVMVGWVIWVSFTVLNICLSMDWHPRLLD